MSNVQKISESKHSVAEWLIDIGNPAQANRLASSELLSASSAKAAEIERRISAAAPESILAPALARVAVVCARRLEDDQTADFTLLTYVNELQQFPGDIALAVVANWPSVSKFWPTWKELYDILDIMMIERRAVMSIAREKAGLPRISVDDCWGGEAGALVRSAARKIRSDR